MRKHQVLLKRFAYSAETSSTEVEYRAALKENPKDAAAHNRLGVIAEKQGKAELPPQRHHAPPTHVAWGAGVTIGRTDDVGYNIADDPISVYDLHATILHLMGLDHTRLTYRFQGRDFRLTTRSVFAGHRPPNAPRRESGRCYNDRVIPRSARILRTKTKNWRPCALLVVVPWPGRRGTSGYAD